MDWTITLGTLIHAAVTIVTTVVVCRANASRARAYEDSNERSQSQNGKKLSYSHASATQGECARQQEDFHQQLTLSKAEETPKRPSLRRQSQSGKESRHSRPSPVRDDYAWKYEDCLQLFTPIKVAETPLRKGPCTLNERGLQVAAELDAYAVVDKYYSQLAIPDDASEWQIQKQCFAFAHTILLQVVKKDEKAKIEKAIYEDRGNVDNTLDVYGVLFRNKFLEKFGYPVPKDGSPATR